MANATFTIINKANCLSNRNSDISKESQIFIFNSLACTWSHVYVTC